LNKMKNKKILQISWTSSKDVQVSGENIHLQIQLGSRSLTFVTGISVYPDPVDP
jgi:hypothetical protein